MGRLAGFKYRRIIKKLKSLGFEFFVTLQEAMGYGITQLLIDSQLYRDIIPICLKEQ